MDTPSPGPLSFYLYVDLSIEVNPPPCPLAMQKLPLAYPQASPDITQAKRLCEKIPEHPEQRKERGLLFAVPENVDVRIPLLTPWHRKNWIVFVPEPGCHFGFLDSS